MKKRIKKIQFDCDSCNNECTIIYRIPDDIQNVYIQCCPFCGEEVDYYDTDEKEEEDDDMY